MRPYTPGYGAAWAAGAETCDHHRPSRSKCAEHARAKLPPPGGELRSLRNLYKTFMPSLCAWSYHSLLDNLSAEVVHQVT